MSIVNELIVVVCLIVANGLFAGAEIAVLAVRKTRVRELAAEGRRAARALLRLREAPESFFATVQVGITVVGATAAALGGARVARAIAPSLERIVGTRHAEDVALAIVVGGLSFLSIVLGELVPKSLALRAAERYALIVARPLLALSQVARPIIWLLTLTSNLMLRIFRDRTTFTESRLSKDELQELIDEAASTGDLDPRAGEIAYRALDFGEVRVGALMIPRAEMVVLHQDATRDQIRELLLRHGHARFPVHADVPEDVVGYVTARDLLALVAGDEERLLRDVVRDALFVPEIRRAGDVLKDMQRTRDHLALVVDEQGSVAGLVALEDLLEELVGEIFAEHEAPVERIRHEADGRILVRGRIPVHEVNRELGIGLPESSSWSTIGGLAIALAGRVPSAGAQLDAGDGTMIEVVDVTERSVQRVRIRPSRSRRSSSPPPSAMTLAPRRTHH